MVKVRFWLGFYVAVVSCAAKIWANFSPGSLPFCENQIGQNLHPIHVKKGGRQTQKIIVI